MHMFGLVDSIAGPTIAPQLPYAIATVVHLDGTPSHPSTIPIVTHCCNDQVMIDLIDIYAITNRDYK